MTGSASTSAGAMTSALANGGIDRRADERGAPGLLEAARAAPSTRVLVVRGDAVPLARRPEEPTADAAGADDGQPQPRLRLHSVSEVAGEPVWAFLGRDADGAAVLAAVFAEDAPDPLPATHEWGSLRVIGGALPSSEAALFVEALSLGRWLVEAPHCPACGALAEVRSAGWSRQCPVCGREHFPRTDPAVIVAVESADGQRLLLGSNAMWGQERYSCFAGFVEAGESLEAGVEREVAEESGIRVAHMRYRGSQAWPYPRSLMLGFRARAAADDEARADGTEIVQVRWFTRAQVADAFAGRSEVKLPGTASIAHALIRDWLEDSAG